MSRLIYLAASLLALGLTACGGGDDHGHEHADEGGHAHDADGGHAEEGDDHGHGHGGGVVVTDYTETAELFVEFPPFAVGRESPFAAHFTRLDTFEPVSEGEAIVRLSGGGAAEEVFRAEPAPTAGIFRPVAVPRHATRRRVTVELRSGDVTSLHDLGEYQVYRNASEADSSLPEHGEEQELVPFLKEQQWKVDFSTAPIVSGRLSRSISAPGSLAVSSNAQSVISAPADGQLSAPSGGFPYLGTGLSRGEILARIAPRLGGDLDRATLVADMNSTAAALEAARRDYERAEGLLEDGAVPRKRLEEAESALRQAEARAEAAQTRLNASGGGGGVTLTAPISGRLVEINASDGNFVSAGEPLFRIVNDDRLRLVARVAEADLPGLTVPQGAWFKIPGSDVVYDLENLDGRLVSAQIGVDPRTRTLPVMFEFNNPGARFSPGTSVIAGVRTSDGFTGPIIPASAVIDDAGQDVVYVMADGENWERRVVRIALRDGDQLGISSGVETGERVVSQGAYLVHLAASGPAEAGHGHAH